MRGTLRTFDNRVRERLLARIKGIASGIAESMQATCTVEDRYGAPPVVNDPELAAIVMNAIVPVMGDQRVVASGPSGTGDDFAYFAEATPGCLFLVGSSDPARGLDKPHHHPSFDIDEACLSVGAASLEASVRQLLALG
jgi:amidohydrolase